MGLSDGTSCGSGEICFGGSCVGGCDIAGSYVAPGGVDPQNPCLDCEPPTSTSSYSNMATGTSCATGKVCTAGACTAGCGIQGSFYPPGAPETPDACTSCQPSVSASSWSPIPDGDSCGAGGSNVCCSGACTDTSTDDGNCGTCANACPAASSCTSGSCVCTTSGLTACPSGCTNTTNDGNNCGTCGNVCPTASACGGGVCNCSTQGLTACSTGCTDVQTDGNNCGTCGNICPSPNGFCSAGVCKALMTLTNSLASSLASDVNAIYWTTSFGGAVEEVPLAGGQVVTLVASGAYGIAVQSGKVYWTGSGTLNSVPVGGTGASTRLATVPGGVSSGIGLDSSSVYFTAGNGGAGVIYSYSIAGAIATAIYTASPGPYVDYLAVANGSVYWTDDDEYVAQVAVTGGSYNILASGLGEPASIAADADNVYWIDYYDSATDSGDVKKVALSGGSPPVALATGVLYPGGIAIDDTYVYWTSASDNGSVWKVAIVGGASPIELATNQVYYNCCGGRDRRADPR